MEPEATELHWRREAIVFARALVGRKPSAYVTERYLGFHRGRDLPRADRFGRVLVAVARVHPIATRMCDAYAARVRPGCELRRKLVLVLALVECAPDTYELVERPGPGGALLGLPRLVGRGLLEVLALVMGVAVLAPVHLVNFLAPESNEEGA